VSISLAVIRKKIKKAEERAKAKVKRGTETMSTIFSTFAVAFHQLAIFLLPFFDCCLYLSLLFPLPFLVFT